MSRTHANTVSALEVAEFFINKSNEEKKPITNKKLQKLLYYAQVWSTVINDEKLFPERMEAWVHGPAIPKVYRKYKSFEFNPILIDTSGISFDFTDDQEKVLNLIWEVYGKYDANYLEALSHSELPWQEARQNVTASESSNKIISLATAKKFYGRKLEQVTA